MPDAKHAPSFPKAKDFNGLGWTIAVTLALLAGGVNPYYPLLRGITELIGAALVFAALAAGSSRKPRLCAFDWIALGALLLVLAQLVPLPPALWRALPGRDLLVQEYSALGLSIGWRAMSLQPERTLDSALTLLFPAGLYLAVRTGPPERTGYLLRGVVVALFVAIVHAIVQKLTGRAAWTYPFAISDTMYVSGFFTNHNHLATFLMAATPLAIVWRLPLAGRAATPDRPAPEQRAGTGSTTRSPTSGNWPLGAIIAAAALVVAVSLGVILTASRAGLALLPVLLAGLALTFVAGRGRGQNPVVPLGAVLGVVFALGLGFIILSGRLSIGAFDRLAPLGEDLRFLYWERTISLIGAYAPVGSGFGTFPDVYAMAQPRTELLRSYINHAHADYLELLLEGGIFAAALMIAFFGAFSLQLWKARRDAAALPLWLCMLAASIPLLHSLVDYPMRTAAIAGLFALAIAAMIERSVESGAIAVAVR